MNFHAPNLAESTTSGTCLGSARRLSRGVESAISFAPLVSRVQGEAWLGGDLASCLGRGVGIAATPEVRKPMSSNHHKERDGHLWYLHQIDEPMVSYLHQIHEPTSTNPSWTWLM